jgi:hypothetical protein
MAPLLITGNHTTPLLTFLIYDPHYSSLHSLALAMQARLWHRRQKGYIIVLFLVHLISLLIFFVHHVFFHLFVILISKS